MIWTDAAGHYVGTRFYLSYSGSAPSGANCVTLAGDIEAQWAAHLAAETSVNYSLKEVDVLDIATDSGLSGQWTGTSAGSISDFPVAYQVAFNVEYNVAIRYRGGKPRGYWPFGTVSDLATYATWDSARISSVNTAIAAFFTAIEALSIGSMGTLAHVMLSYYDGYTTRTTGGGQTTFKPKYRTDFAYHYAVTGYSAKAELSSQKRRRTSTTP
jgi:hypothetical protein